MPSGTLGQFQRLGQRGFVPEQGPKLQADISRIPQTVNLGKYRLVVDFIPRQFMPARHPCRVNVSNDRQIRPQQGDEIAFRDLLVIDVKEDGQRRGIHLRYQIRRLRHRGQPVTLMIHHRIEGFQEQHEAVILTDGRHGLEPPPDAAHGHIRGFVSQYIARGHDQARGSQLLCGLYGIPDAFHQSGFRVPGDQTVSWLAQKTCTGESGFGLHGRHGIQILVAPGPEFVGPYAGPGHPPQFFHRILARPEHFNAHGESNHFTHHSSYIRVPACRSGGSPRPPNVYCHVPARTPKV